VNIASLPSTVTVVAGAACHFGRGWGGTGSWALAKLGNSVLTLMRHANIHDVVFISYRLIPFAGRPIPRVFALVLNLFPLSFQSTSVPKASQETYRRARRATTATLAITRCICLHCGCLQLLWLDGSFYE
jgi:hypothetical protein